MLFASLGSACIVKNYDRGQHFQARSHSLTLYGPTLSRQITYLFLSSGKLAYKWVCLRNFGIKLAIGLANHSSERASNKDVLLKKRCT